MSNEDESVIALRSCVNVSQWQIRKFKRADMNKPLAERGKIICTCYNRNAAKHLFEMLSKYPGDIFGD